MPAMLASDRGAAPAPSRATRSGNPRPHRRAEDIEGERRRGQGAMTRTQKEGEQLHGSDVLRDGATLQFAARAGNRYTGPPPSPSPGKLSLWQFDNDNAIVLAKLSHPDDRIAQLSGGISAKKEDSRGIRCRDHGVRRRGAQGRDGNKDVACRPRRGAGGLAAREQHQYNGCVSDSRIGVRRRGRRGRRGLRQPRPGPGGRRRYRGWSAARPRPWRQPPPRRSRISKTPWRWAGSAATAGRAGSGAPARRRRRPGGPAAAPTATSVAQNANDGRGRLPGHRRDRRGRVGRGSVRRAPAASPKRLRPKRPGPHTPA